MFMSVVERLVGPERFRFMRWHRYHCGLWPAVLGQLAWLVSKDLPAVVDPATGVQVRLRPGTADLDVFDQVFVWKDYNFELGNPKTIVDAGAHIGLASVYFARHYPKATIISLEPEASNFALLKRNAARYPNIRPLQAGLWSERATLEIQDPTVATWSFRVTESRSGSGIAALGVGDLMDDLNLGHIDVLKIDIEGSEVEVLGSAGPWLDKVGTMIIEMHDRFRPGCTEALHTALSTHSFDLTEAGENIVVSNIRPRSPAAA